MHFLQEPNTILQELLFPASVTEGWNNIDPGTCTCSSYNIFCNILIKFLEPAEMEISNINTPLEINF